MRSANPSTAWGVISAACLQNECLSRCCLHRMIHLLSHSLQHASRSLISSERQLLADMQQVRLRCAPSASKLACSRGACMSAAQPQTACSRGAANDIQCEPPAISWPAAFEGITYSWTAMMRTEMDQRETASHSDTSCGRPGPKGLAGQLDRIMCAAGQCLGRACHAAQPVACSHQAVKQQLLHHSGSIKRIARYMHTRLSGCGRATAHRRLP